jgi:hypothetical protein
MYPQREDIDPPVPQTEDSDPPVPLIEDCDPPDNFDPPFYNPVMPNPPENVNKHKYVLNDPYALNDPEI